jgi:hypothetical protein
LQAQLAIDTTRLVLPVPPSLATQQDVDAAIAVTDADMADLFDSLFESGLTYPSGEGRLAE